MEMKKVELIKRLFTNEEIIAIDNRNRELEEENKKLKEEVEILKNLNLGERMEYLKCIEELKKENEELQEYKSMYEGLC